MGYAKQKNMMVMWGIATSEPKLRTTQSGKHVCSFYLQYNKHVNEDGQKVKESISVTAWNELAEYICDNDIGIGKYDELLVCGEIVLDTYYGQDEDPNIPKYKINAELILPMTSIYQLMMMVVNGGANIKPQDTGPKPRSMTKHGQIDVDDEPEDYDSLFVDDNSADESDPFSSDDGELPY